MYFSLSLGPSLFSSVSHHAHEAIGDPANQPLCPLGPGQQRAKVLLGGQSALVFEPDHMREGHGEQLRARLEDCCRGTRGKRDRKSKRKRKKKNEGDEVFLVLSRTHNTSYITAWNTALSPRDSVSNVGDSVFDVGKLLPYNIKDFGKKKYGE